MKYNIVELPPKKAWGAPLPPLNAPLPPPPSLTLSKRADFINEWFYSKCADDVSPALSVCVITSSFYNYLKNADIELCMDFKNFRNSICNAVCLYAYNDFFDISVDPGTPFNIQKLPKGWNSDTEYIWHDYVQTFYLNFEFWDSFWKTFNCAFWENRFPNIRNYLQSILLYYIKYDNDLLIENELIAVNNDGDYVDPIEIEEYDEDEMD